MSSETSAAPPPGNRLGRETSPYLLQHADNPVRLVAVGRRRRSPRRSARRKPILLSIGYAACHWCHVMAHESFEDAEIGGLMNELFVSIKVDREERPDVDADLHERLHAHRRQGGWPLTMFLDARRHARSSAAPTFRRSRATGGRRFQTVLARGVPALARASADEVAQRRRGNSRATSAGGAASAERADLRPTPRLSPRGRPCVASAVDPVHGGLGGAPKFPQWSSTSGSCWRSAIRSAIRRAKPSMLMPRRTMAARAASTTTSAAASRATRSTRSGSCRTSRRCSTTMRLLVDADALAIWREPATTLPSAA